MIRVASVCLIFAAFGCGAPESDSEPEDLGTTSEALSSFYSWSSGSAPVRMISATTGFCVLSNVEGAFFGPDTVLISVDSGN
jgi:hypothetical protein